MEIQPDKQNLDRTFSNIVYHIDFYQRSYKWTTEPVRRLFDDILFQFEAAWEKNTDMEIDAETIQNKFPWYYLNTYVTNSVDGRVYVVDGQQRLTTLTLTLIKLLHMVREHSRDQNLERWIDSKIAGYSGSGLSFWMNHKGHIHVLQDLHRGVSPASIDATSGVTARNMLINYQLISSILDERLDESAKLKAFVYYFLQRLVLINLDVDSTHVPMVFEVINDRGVRLKPYEILKGKLLGQIDKTELSSLAFAEVWDARVQDLAAYGEDSMDDFFRSWLKGRFADTRPAGRRFDGDYHREMFKADMNALLRLEHNPQAVKKFFKGEFEYYTELYARVQELSRHLTQGFESVFYNGPNIMQFDFQSALILSACTVHDPDSDAKIRAVSEGVDRMATLLRLQGLYASNEFLDRLFLVTAEIRDTPVGGISEIFDRHLQAECQLRSNLSTAPAFSQRLFHSMTLVGLNSRFARYFLARIEQYVADAMKLRMKHSVHDLVSRTGSKTGFHFEHILSNNEENKALFDGDLELFDMERARLGGILLLKGRDNISSNNEPYRDKLKSYAGSLYWNETLRRDTYKANLDFRDAAAAAGLHFRPMDEFSLPELNERQRLLFEITGRIWPLTNQ